MSRIALLATCLLLSASAAATEIVLDNPDFEKTMLGDRIPGWSRTQHAGVRAYKITSDTDNHARGKSSIRMLRTTEQAYGLISQQLDIPDLAGKRVELKAALKSEGVGKKGWVMVLTFQNFSNILDQTRIPITGDTDWKDVVINKVAPIGTNRIEVGFMLLDGGTGWADNVRLRTIEDEKQATEVGPVKSGDGKSDAALPEQGTKAPEPSKGGQAGH